jgi:O-antigen/teichoic acid export membrane protein
MFSIANYFKISETKKKIFNNISWAFIGKVVEILSGLLIGVLVARYLQPEGYGIYNYTIGFVGLFTLLSEFGITGIAIRDFAKKSTNINFLFGSVIGIRLVFSCITILIIIAITLTFEDNPQLRLFIIIYSLNYIFLSFSATFRNFFSSQLKNEFIIKSILFRTLIVASIKIAFIIFKAPILAFIIIMTADSFVLLFFFLYFFNKKYGNPSEFKFKLNIALTLIKNSAPLLLSGISAILYQKIDVVMVGKLINVQSVGYYSAALKFIQFSIFIPLVISQTLSPLLMQKLESVKYDTNNKQYINYRNRFGDLIVYSGLLISIFLFVFAAPMINILYGKEYSKGINILRILAWKGFFSGIGFAGSQIIIYEGRAKLVYLRNIIGGTLNLALNFLLIPYFGVKGVALATIISYSAGTFFSNFFITPYRKDFLLQCQFIFKGNLRIIQYIRILINKRY